MSIYCKRLIDAMAAKKTIDKSIIRLLTYRSIEAMSLIIKPCSRLLTTHIVDCIHDARKEGVVEGEGGYMRIKELQAWAETLNS